MKTNEYLRVILEGISLQEKLIDIPLILDFEIEDIKYQLPTLPGRSNSLKIAEKNVKFPSKESFHLPAKRGMALHFFANHELLAIEMMAGALLTFPQRTQEDLNFKRGILHTLRDEQRHLKHYHSRMKELGVELGDYPLNGFLWKAMMSIKSSSQYLAVLSLTFEAANLDFAKFYQTIFHQVEDFKTEEILKTVYEEEIAHVAFGRKWLDRWKGEKALWDYYCSLLPHPLTPARSKGIQFNSIARMKAGFSEEFLQQIKEYRDPFRVTNRKSWNVDACNDFSE